MKSFNYLLITMLLLIVIGCKDSLAQKPKSIASSPQATPIHVTQNIGASPSQSSDISQIIEKSEKFYSTKFSHLLIVFGICVAIFCIGVTAVLALKIIDSIKFGKYKEKIDTLEKELERNTTNSKETFAQLDTDHKSRTNALEEDLKKTIAISENKALRSIKMSEADIHLIICMQSIYQKNAWASAYILAWQALSSYFACEEKSAYGKAEFLIDLFFNESTRDGLTTEKLKKEIKQIVNYEIYTKKAFNAYEKSGWSGAIKPKLEEFEALLH